MDKFNFFMRVSILLAISPICRAVNSTSPATEIISYDNFKLYKIEGTDKALDKLLDELLKISAFDQDYTYSDAGYEGKLTYYTVLFPPESEEQFKEIVDRHPAVTRTLLSSDFSAYVKSEQAPPGKEFSWDYYYDTDEIFAFLNKTSASYSNTKVVVGGTSYEGRKILGLRIKSGGKGKPAFLIHSGSHAREWITPTVANYLINQLLTSTDPQIIAMRDQFDWYIFPLTNPDGYHYSFTNDRFWRKSRSVSPSGCHGVDLNRNWATENWSIYASSNDSCDYQFFAGPKPFSEPETKSFSKYIASIKNLQVYVDMFADSQQMFIPYTCCIDEQVDNYDDLIKIGKVSLKYGYRVNGAKYGGPRVYQASGQSIDWVKKNLKVPLVFEYELRGDNFDWPPSKIYQQGDEFTQMILGLVTEANKLGYFKNP